MRIYGKQLGMIIHKNHTNIFKLTHIKIIAMLILHFTLVIVPKVYAATTPYMVMLNNWRDLHLSLSFFSSPATMMWV